MELALDKCAQITFRGKKQNFDIVGEDLANADIVKDLGINIKDDLSWSKTIEERLRKANKVLYLLRRNVAVQVKPLIKLGLYKSLILPVLMYGWLHLHKPITKRAIKPRTLSGESSEMDHGKQRNELHQSTSAAQHSPLAYVSPSERPTSTCKSHA